MSGQETRHVQPVNNLGHNGNTNSEDKVSTMPPLSFDLAKEAMAIHLQSPMFSKKENTSNTIGSLDELTTINRNGFITTNSQEGVIDQGFNKETKRFWKTKERGCLVGLMRLSRGGKFIKWINSNTDKIAFLTDIVNDEDFEAHFTRKAAHTGSAPLESFFPSIVVTLEGTSETSSEDIKLFAYSHLPLIRDKRSLDSEKEEVRLKKEEEVILITLIDPTYGRLCKSPEGLYADVMKGLAAVPDDVSSSNGPKKSGTRRNRPLNKLPAINGNSEYNLGYNNITNAPLIMKMRKTRKQRRRLR